MVHSGKRAHYLLPVLNCCLVSSLVWVPVYVLSSLMQDSNPCYLSESLVQYMYVLYQMNCNRAGRVLHQYWRGHGMDLNPAQAWMNRTVKRSLDPSSPAPIYWSELRSVFATRVLILAGQTYLRGTAYLESYILVFLQSMSPCQFLSDFLFTTCCHLVEFITATIVHI